MGKKTALRALLAAGVLTAPAYARWRSLEGFARAPGPLGCAPCAAHSPTGVVTTALACFLLAGRVGPQRSSGQARWHLSVRRRAR